MWKGREAKGGSTSIGKVSMHIQFMGKVGAATVSLLVLLSVTVTSSSAVVVVAAAKIR